LDATTTDDHADTLKALHAASITAAHDPQHVKDVVAKMAAKLSTPQLKEIAKKFGINNTGGSKAAIADAINRKIVDRREMFQRTQGASGDDSKQHAAVVAKAAAAGLPMGKREDQPLTAEDEADIAKRFGKGANEEATSKEYEKANAEFNAASVKHREITKMYREKKVGDKEFLASKKEFEAASKRFDDAYAAFQSSISEP